MSAEARRYCAVAALLLAVATVISALAAHTLKPHLSAEQASVLQVAVQFQFLHALGLLALGIILDRLSSGSLRWAMRLLLIGVLFFSGSLYLLLLGAPHLVGVLTPLGGLCLMLGWLVAALSLWPRRVASAP